MSDLSTHTGGLERRLPLTKNDQSSSRPDKGLTLQERWLTANYNAQSFYEHRALKQKWEEVLKDYPSGSYRWCHALFTGLSLITGRSQSRLMKLGFDEKPGDKEWWTISEGEVRLYYRPNIIRNDLEELLHNEKYRDLVNVIKTGAFPLPIPSAFTKPLMFWRKMGPSHKKGIKRAAGKIIKKLQKYETRPYSAGRISSALSYYLATKNCGIADIGYLTGLSPRRCVALHYSQLKVSEVIPPYNEFLLELGFSANEIPSVSDSIVGTALTVSEHALSNLLSKQVRPLLGAVADKIDEYLKFHNDIVYMAWIYIQLSTGHRHNIGALKSILHFDLKSGVLIVEDKTTRPHILSKSVVLQLEYFINYLQNFRRVAEICKPELASLIEDSLSGDAPLFFLLSSKGERRVFSVDNLNKLVHSYWQFPANWARHYTLTTLVTILPADQFPAWAGHLEGEKEADDRFSGLTPNEQKAASEAMEQALERVGVLPFNPCTRQLTAVSDSSALVSLKKLKAWNASEKERLERDQDYKNQVNTSKVFWTKERLQKCASLWHWEAEFETCLERLSKEDSSVEEWMMLSIYSAMTRGGLTKPEMVYTFYTQLRRGEINWWTAEGRCYFDLSYKVEKGLFNLREKEDRAFRQMHWPIDIQTLSLVLAGPFHADMWHHSLPVGKVAFAEWLSQWFNGDDGSWLGSLKELCKCIPFIQWFALKADVSYAETYISGSQQHNFAPNRSSLISLIKAPLRIEWPKHGRHKVARKKVTRRRKKGGLTSPFGENATGLILDLLGKNDSQSNAVRNIQAFMNQGLEEWPLEAQILVQWLEYKLSHIKVSTARGYVSSIAPEWFTAVQDCNFDVLSADEIFAVYQRIYNGTNDPGKRDIYVQRLRWLHQYGMEEYGWPINDALATFLKTRSSLTYVRTSVVDCRHVHNTLEALDRLEADEIFKAQLKLILIIGFRCGLRIGEILKLRFRDVDAESDWALYIRGSRLGSNKSDNALRKLEFAKLASEEELELLKQYYHELIIDRQIPDYVFGLGGENIPLDQVKCSQILGGALRQSTGNSEVVFHSLRHSWASMTFAIIGKERDLAEQFTGLDREKLAAIRKYWLRSEDLTRDGLWQLARALGHATPATSAQTYLHLVPEMVHRKLARVIWPSSSVQKSLKNLLNFRQGELDTMGYDLVMNRLAKQVRKHTGEERIPAKQGRHHKPNLTFGLPATYLILASAIEKVAEGQTIVRVAEQYPVSEQDLENIVYRCKKLASMKTKKRARKLVDRRVKAENGDDANYRNILLPSLHESPDVRRLAMDIANTLRQRCQKKRARKAIIQQAMAVLKTFTVSKHYLLIRKREDLSEILSFAQGLVPEEYWRFEGNVLFKRDEENEKEKRKEAYDYWFDVLPLGAAYRESDVEPGDKKSSNQYGVINATLGHSKQCLDSGKKCRRHGVKMLAWLSYMTVVIYGTNEEVDAFTNA